MADTATRGNSSNVIWDGQVKKSEFCIISRYVALRYKNIVANTDLETHVELGVFGFLCFYRAYSEEVCDDTGNGSAMVGYRAQ